LGIFGKFRQSLFVINQELIKNGTNSLNHSDIDHRANMSDFVNISIGFDVTLETSVENVVTNIVDILSEKFLFKSRSGFVKFVLSSQQPAVHFGHPSDIGLVNE